MAKRILHCAYHDDSIPFSLDYRATPGQHKEFSAIPFCKFFMNVILYLYIFWQLFVIENYSCDVLSYY